jgi:hypothetical protein|tara:strand:- start:182 stop:754 length:573 start_codon:yes stop_codon:yes gene_type:complete
VPSVTGKAKKMIKTSNAIKNSRNKEQKLSPSMQRMRMKILKSVQDETLDDALSFLRDHNGNTKDVNIRLASLAAQTWIIRQKISQIGSAVLPTVKDLISDLNSKNKNLRSNKTEVTDADGNQNLVDETTKKWQKVKILQETEVNGMQFFENTTINVTPENADRLFSANKAVLVDDSNADVSKQKKQTKAK